MPDEAFDLRLAAPFVVLAEELHFGRAAERLGTGQPALSRQLSRLERQLGAQLVDRSGGHVALTAAGARFLVEVRDMLVRATRIEAALRGGGGELRLHLGAANHPTVGEIVGSFVAAHPEIVVRTAEDAPTRSAQAVRDGEADVGFAQPQDATPDLHFAPVASAPLGVVTAVDHPIVARGRAAWTDLEGETLIIAPPGFSDGWVRLLRTTLGRMDVHVREMVGQRIPRVTYVQHRLVTGAAVLVVPSWTVDPLPPRVAWTVLEPRQPVELGVVWNACAADGPVGRFVAWARARSPVSAVRAAADAREE